MDSVGSVTGHIYHHGALPTRPPRRPPFGIPFFWHVLHTKRWPAHCGFYIAQWVMLDHSDRYAAHVGLLFCFDRLLSYAALWRAVCRACLAAVRGLHDSGGGICRICPSSTQCVSVAYCEGVQMIAQDTVVVV